MKKSICMILILIATLACSRGKTMVVTAESGLRFHSEPKLDATVLELLPNGTHVKVLQADGPSATIDKITANWMEAEVHDKKGWVFSGYLSEDPVYLEKTGQCLKQAGKAWFHDKCVNEKIAQFLITEPVLFGWCGAENYHFKRNGKIYIEGMYVPGPFFTVWEIREDQLWIRTRSELSDPKSLVSCQMTFQENVVTKTCPPYLDGVVYPIKYKKAKDNVYHFMGKCDL